MDFTFTQEQRLFQESVRGLLSRECTADYIRSSWDSDSGRSDELWGKLAELGLLGVLVPEAHGGLGMTEMDLVLALEETGRAALPEPVAETAAVAAPLLAELQDNAVAARHLAAIAEGKSRVAVGHAVNPFVADAHVADLLLMQSGDEIHALAPGAATLVAQPGSDPSRRLSRVDWQPSESTCVASGERGRDLLVAALDRGAVAVAAQQVGVAQQLVDLAVAYACEREQFGKPIGSFQAIKHLLANVAVRIEFARPVLARAAFSVSTGAASRSTDASHAKAAACEAAVAAAKTSLQVHGAIGYTWEVDLQIWMKKAWALDKSWGSPSFHRARIAEALIDGDGSAESFGFSPA